jgi:hypothetical protein
MNQALWARVMMIVGFLAALVGYNAWITARTLLDPDATRVAARTLVTTPAVQRSLSDNVTRAVEDKLTEAGADPEIRAAVGDALRDPRVATAFADAVASLMEEHDGRIMLDAGPLTAAVHDALERHDPELAADLATKKPLRVELDADKVPNLSTARAKVQRTATIGIACAILLIGGSLLMVRDRKAIMRLGRRTVYLATGPLLLYALAPRLLDGHGDVPATIARVLHSYSGRAVPSAVVLVVSGATIALTAMVWRKPAVPVAAPVAATPRATGPLPDPRFATPPDRTATDKLYL